MVATDATALTVEPASGDEDDTDATGEEEEVSDPYGVLDEEPEPEAGAESEAEPELSKEDEMAAARALKGDRFNQWHLQVAPGFGYMKGLLGTSWSASGPALRLGAWKLGWRKGFLIGGGPALVWGSLRDKVNEDWVNMGTLNGDLIVGGGKSGKFAVYGHLTLGLGVASFSDGATGSSGIVPAGRGAIGLGGDGHMSDKISVAALAVFNYVYAAWALDTFITLNIHFAPRT
jgi:hypothetical protein